MSDGSFHVTQRKEESVSAPRPNPLSYSHTLYSRLAKPGCNVRRGGRVDGSSVLGPGRPGSAVIFALLGLSGGF